MYSIHNLSTECVKEFGYVSDNGWKMLKMEYNLFYANFNKFNSKQALFDL